MNKIVLNNTEFEVESFNKTTNFSGGMVSGTGYVSILGNVAATLTELAAELITSIKIYHDNNLIYSLEDIHCKIDSLNEYLAGDRMNTSINLTFNETIVEEN